MNINFEYYKVFYYAAKLGSFSKAAEALMNSQPNLTRTIKVLESELGCVLFTRSNKGLSLTPDGERLYRHIEIAYRHICEGEDEISMNKGLARGVITVGASEVALHCLLLPVLKQYRNMYPGVKMFISNFTTSQAIDAVRDGTVDIAVVTAPRTKPSGLILKNIVPITETAVCGMGFPAFEEPIPLAELERYPLIMLNSKTLTYEFYAELFARNGARFFPTIEAATADQILPMVRADLGIGFVPLQFLEGAEDIRVLKLREEIPHRSVALIRRRDQLSAAARELEKLVVSQGGMPAK